MMDKERISLAAQITRCYSDNGKSPFRTHMVISSFGGKLKERFETVLSGQYRSWKGVQFFEEDFVRAAEEASKVMRSSRGGKLAGVLATTVISNDESGSEESQAKEGELVYLTSDSPNTLESLKPYSNYIIGGLVDRNREKGICYKRACDKGIKTAKLPISDYL